MQNDQKHELLSTLNQFNSLKIAEQLDYNKFYLYSIITHSTAIEGSTVTEIENQLLFDEGISAKKPMAEQLMNLDLKAAYEQSFTFAKEHEDISVKMLCELSSIVMKNTGTFYKNITGEFSSAKGELRLVNVSAGRGGKSYLAYQKVTAKLEDFCKQINERRKSIDPKDIYSIYKLSFDAHYLLVQIHPWADGNGRMSRLIMNQIQMEYGVIPSCIHKENKAAYIEALVKSEETDDLTPFRNFMFSEHINTLKKQISEYEKSINKYPFAIDDGNIISEKNYPYSANNILSGETSTLEYKKQIPEDHTKFLKTVIAFANGKGGRIIFGIDDVTHKVLGMDEENIFKTIDSISDMIYNNCTPFVPCEVLLQTIEKKTVIVVDIHQGLHTPYYIKSLGLENGCFIRTSATTRLADSQTLRELMFEGSDTGYDQAPQNGKTVTEDEVQVLCDSLKNVALENCKTDDERQAVKELTKNNLISWQLLSEKDGKLVPSNGFDLLSNNSIWSAKIQCGIFKGTDRTIFVDKREYEGSIQNQIKEAYDFVLRNIHLGAEIEGLYRRDVYEIPATVIRELIINAVVHRNYLESSHIQIAIFDDRLEITSPGSLPKGVTIEKMKEGFSKIRNQGVANAFHYMRLIEHWGTGIPRIIKLVKESGLPNLEIIDIDGALRISIYRKNGDKSAINLQNGDKSATNSKIGDKSAINLPKKDEKTLILEYLQTHEESTTKAIGEMLGLKSSRTKDYLNDLEESGFIIAKGANKNRTYIIKDSK